MTITDITKHLLELARNALKALPENARSHQLIEQRQALASAITQCEHSLSESESNNETTALQHAINELLESLPETNEKYRLAKQLNHLGDADAFGALGANALTDPLAAPATSDNNGASEATDNNTTTTMTHYTPNKHDNEHISAIPDELLMRILMYCTDDPNSLAAVASTCTYLYNLMKDPAFNTAWPYRSIRVLPAPGLVQCITTLPDGRIASGSRDNTVRVWDLNTGEAQILQGHAHWVYCITTLPDGRIASGSWDKTVRVWDLNTGEAQILQGHTDSVSCITTLPDGRIASGSWDYTVRVWDLNTGEPLILRGHTYSVRCITTLPDGRIASGSRDNTVRVWDLNTGEPQILQGHTYAVWRIATLPDGRIASCSHDNTVRVWDLNTGEAQILQGHTDLVMSITTLPDGRIASASWDSTVRVWEDNCPYHQDITPQAIHRGFHGYLPAPTNPQPIVADDTDAFGLSQHGLFAPAQANSTGGTPSLTNNTHHPLPEARGEDVPPAKRQRTSNDNSNSSQSTNTLEDGLERATKRQKCEDGSGNPTAVVSNVFNRPEHGS